VQEGRANRSGATTTSPSTAPAWTAWGTGTPSGRGPAPGGAIAGRVRPSPLLAGDSRAVGPEAWRS